MTSKHQQLRSEIIDSLKNFLERKNTERIALWLQVAVIVTSVVAALYPLVGLLTAALAVGVLFTSRRISKEKDILIGELKSYTADVADHAASISDRVASTSKQVEAIQKGRGRRYTKYRNTRSLDVEGFVMRLVDGQKGVVTLAFPKNLPQPVDNFFEILLNSLERAEWSISSKMEDFDVSAYGITLKAIVKSKNAIPPHFHTLKNALEKSGVPVHVDVDIQSHTRKEVFLVVGSEPP